MCGSDAVPQNRAIISEMKSSLSTSLSLRTPLNVELPPGCIRSVPLRGVGV